MFGISVLLASCPVQAFRLFKIGEKKEIQMGQEIAVELDKEYGTEENARITEIGKKLAAVSDRPKLPYTFKILKMPDPNAFACPGGAIFITKSLLDKVKSDDELAAILAHEVAHAARRHSMKEYEKAMSASVLVNIGLAAAGAGNTANTIAGVGFNLIQNGRSRSDENNADEYGVRYAEKAGFDPKAFVTMFETLQSLSNGKEPPKLLSTHPPTKDRIENVKKIMTKLEQEKAAKAKPTTQAE
jgi:predicted Zn-dependent protease